MDWIEKWSARNPGARLVVQHGNRARGRRRRVQRVPAHPSASARCWPNAAAVVCPGGPGAIMETRAAGLRPIVVPRRGDLGEHVDNHQLAFSRFLAGRDLVTLAETDPDLVRRARPACSSRPTRTRSPRPAAPRPASRASRRSSTTWSGAPDDDARARPGRSRPGMTADREPVVGRRDAAPRPDVADGRAHDRDARGLLPRLLGASSGSSRRSRSASRWSMRRSLRRARDRSCPSWRSPLWIPITALELCRTSTRSASSCYRWLIWVSAVACMLWLCNTSTGQRPDQAHRGHARRALDRPHLLRVPRAPVPQHRDAVARAAGHAQGAARAPSSSTT